MCRHAYVNHLPFGVILTCTGVTVLAYTSLRYSRSFGTCLLLLAFRVMLCLLRKRGEG
ncbi:hypothetical protein F5Y13DRAFT_160303 [Hypoxylon sp. FL1857]|nr:hypothetical protein F5Y13DRAFT_160303 [Hypoxylon sp. FL1857]